MYSEKVKGREDTLCIMYIKRHTRGIFGSLFVCMVEVKNSWADFDEILYEHYAIGGYSSLLLYNFLHSVITAWWMQKLFWWGQH
jgi:hypothetical protein